MKWCDGKELKEELEKQLKEITPSTTTTTTTTIEKEVKQLTIEEKKEKQLKEAEGKTFIEDLQLPKTIICKISETKQYDNIENNRVKIFGWCNNIRHQKKNLFIVLRDGTGYIQCVMSGILTETINAIQLKEESTIFVCGKLKKDEKTN